MVSQFRFLLSSHQNVFHSNLFRLTVKIKENDEFNLSTTIGFFVTVP